MDDVTVLLAYFQSTIAALYPNLPEPIVTKNAARDGRQRQGGYAEGFNISNGAFVISCCDGDIVDLGGTFGQITRQYPVVVEYVKRIESAATVTGVGSAPAPALEDPDVRQKRTAVVEALYRPTAAAVPGLYDVRPPRMGRTYSVTADNQAILVSPVTFLCTIQGKRPGT